jgi:DNA-directed RNA polymerase subunit RPC12/RpoP
METIMTATQFFWILAYSSIVGAFLGSRRNDALGGFFCGFFMGPIGWIVIMMNKSCRSIYCRPTRVPVLVACAKCKTVLDFTDLPEGKYKCLQCDKKFDFADNQAVAQKQLEPQPVDNKGCPHCGAKYDFANMAPGVYTCGECDNTINIEVTAVAAAKEIKKTVEQECPRCKSKFALPKVASGNCRCPECTHVFKPVSVA